MARFGMAYRRGFWAPVPGLVILAGLTAPPAHANSVDFFVSMSLGTVTTLGGTVQLPTSNDTLTGSGLLAPPGGMVRRGQITVNRSTAVAAWASIVSAPTHLTCGSIPVPAVFALDASNCSTPAPSACRIYVGVTLDMPHTLLSGHCTAPAMTIQVNFN